MKQIKKENFVIKNMTPFDITIIKRDGKINLISRGTINMNIEILKDGYIEDIPLSKTVLGKIENLPKYKEGTYYIVSSLLCGACPNRSDFLIPNEVVKDRNGNIIGCRSLSINPFFKINYDFPIKYKPKGGD